MDQKSTSVATGCRHRSSQEERRDGAQARHTTTCSTDTFSIHLLPVCSYLHDGHYSVRFAKLRWTCLWKYAPAISMALSGFSFQRHIPWKHGALRSHRFPIISSPYILQQLFLSLQSCFHSIFIFERGVLFCSAETVCPYRKEHRDFTSLHLTSPQAHLHSVRVFTFLDFGDNTLLTDGWVRDHGTSRVMGWRSVNRPGQGSRRCSDTLEADPVFWFSLSALMSCLPRQRGLANRPGRAWMGLID
jgi:hypothetical protein